MSTPVTVLNLLCAGAAKGLVTALEGGFGAATGARLQSRFGAVGAMKEALLAGEPCDLIVVTESMLAALAADGTVRGQTLASLGRVRTGLAVKSGHAPPDVASPEALKAALLAADEVYFPDPERATAGIHFANVMRQLGVFDALQARFRTFPNGATAMCALAAAASARPIGCTQVTEINYTDGVVLVAALPKSFELSTVYTAAVSTQAAAPALAAQFVTLLAGPQSLAVRRAGGFDV